MIETSVKRAALMAVTQDPCFYLFWLILSISAWLNNASPAACDVDTAKPAFDFLSKWVKRHKTHRLRTGRKGRAGSRGGLMEIEAGRRKLRFYCSSSQSGPLVDHAANSVAHRATQAAAVQLFKPQEFSLIHLQTDDTHVNRAGGERWALSDPSEPVIQGAHVKTLLTVNEARCQTQTITLTDGLLCSDPDCTTRWSFSSRDTERNRSACGAYSDKHPETSTRSQNVPQLTDSTCLNNFELPCSVWSDARQHSYNVYEKTSSKLMERHCRALQHNYSWRESTWMEETAPCFFQWNYSLLH